MQPTTKYTFLGFQLTHALDEGKTLDIGATQQALENGDVIDWLATEMPFPELDLSLYLDVNNQADKAEMNKRFEDIHLGYSPGKFGTTNNGLAYLLALALESIQQVTR